MLLVLQCLLLQMTDHNCMFKHFRCEELGQLPEAVVVGNSSGPNR